MGAGMISALGRNRCVFDINFNDGAVLPDCNVGRTNIDGLMECPHDFEVGGHKRWPCLLTWDEITFAIRDPVVLVQVVLEDRRAAEPVDNLQALTTDVDGVHQRAIERTLVLLVFVIVE